MIEGIALFSLYWYNAISRTLSVLLLFATAPATVAALVLYPIRDEGIFWQQYGGMGL